MIVCQCHAITDSDIRAAVRWMRAADSSTVITAGKVYRALGKRADCGGCMPIFLETMRSDASFEIPANLRGLRTAATKERERNEGRRQGHRVSELGTPV